MFIGDYIFGYGSLIDVQSLNRRGMLRRYTAEDLIQCRLSGFQRSWNTVYRGNLFLGIRPVPGIRATPINGVLFPIDERDKGAFMESECSAGDDPLYDLVDVTDHIHNFPHGTEKVLSCVTLKPSNDAPVHIQYQHYVRRALETQGPEFTREFIETTDWSTFRYETRHSAGHDYHMVISEWEPIVRRKQ